MSTPAESLTVGRSAAEQIEKGLHDGPDLRRRAARPAALVRPADAVDVSTRFTRNIHSTSRWSARRWTRSPSAAWPSRSPRRAASASSTRTCRSRTRPTRSTRSSASENGMIVDPITLPPGPQRSARRWQMMASYNISGVPITVAEGQPRRHPHQPRPALRGRTSTGGSSELMTKENLVTAPEGTTLEQAKRILHKHNGREAAGGRRATATSRA